MVVSGSESCGLQPGQPPRTSSLFEAVLDGDHLLRGFRNADIREALYGTTEDDVERRRQSPAVGRMLKRLARARTDREGAAQPSVARQSERTSSAPSSNTTLSPWHSSRSRYSRVVQSEDAHRAEKLQT